MIGRSQFLSCVACFLVAGFAAGQEKTVARFVEFRDGTVMHLQVANEPWKFTVIQPSGQIKAASFLPAQVTNLTLTAEHEFGKKRQLLSYVLKLGSDDFREREDAWDNITKLGPAVCPDLKACIALTTDAEVQARLRDLIHKLHKGNPESIKSRVVFDRFETKQPLWGFLEDSPIVVLVNGKAYPVGRKDVASVSALPPSNRVTVQRVTEKDFPPDCIEEGFEINPVTSLPLKAGDNVEKMFVGKGFILSTSIKDSFVAANTFGVGGKSGNLSVANHNPMWEGEVTIRFCQPGKEHIPAAVDYFGCYIAAVEPKGTNLIAYDLQDRELGKIVTQQTGTEFFAIHSDIPIHKIRIVPNVEIDANYSLDDFIFHFATTVQAAHPDKVLVGLHAGDSILCKDATLKAGQIELHGLPAGLPDLSFPLAKLARVNPPQTPKVQRQDGLFAELTDGSILFAAEAAADPRQKPAFARFPELLTDKSLKAGTELVGIWTTKSGRKLNTPKPGQLTLWDSEAQQWLDVKYLRVLEEVVLWQKQDSSFGAAGYQQFTTVWVASPRVSPDPGSWHLQTMTGEDLVLTAGQAFTGQLTKTVTIHWRGQQLVLPSTQIMSIYQVPAKKD
jgi:hypothetical protein